MSLYRTFSSPGLAGRTGLGLALAMMLLGTAASQTLPVTAAQREQASTVAARGVPIETLAPDAPDVYTVKSGDTLWGISTLYLRDPWRWPQLWGMNLDDIRNPHRIYPGQKLHLLRRDGMAMLSTTPPASAAPDGRPMETVKLSPYTRLEKLPDPTIPALKTSLIEPFLAEPLIVGETDLVNAIRILPTADSRVLMSKGDRAYVRGVTGQPVTAEGPRAFRVFRNATPIKDPDTGKALGYEAQYLGKARLVRGELTRDTASASEPLKVENVAATVDITTSKEEMRAGDKLLPEPPREFPNYVPHGPAQPLRGRIASVYGSAVANAASNQVVTINRGAADGIDVGLVLAIQKNGGVVTDDADPSRPSMRLPDERNGLMMVFRVFDKLSYALILIATDGVRVGDHVVNPR